MPFAESGEVPEELVELLAAQRDRLDRQMTDLRDMRERLNGCIAQARGSGPGPAG